MLLGATAGVALAQSTPAPTTPNSPAPIGTGQPRPGQPRTVPGDTLPRPARVDTVRRGPDSLTIAVPMGRDTTRRGSIDSISAVRDTLKTPPVKRDSIKAPLVRAEMPTAGVIAGPAYRFRGDTVLATGSLTVADLLERIPGVTVFRSGYLASAQTASYLGDFRRIRVFRDGVEVNAVNPRNGNVLDLTDVQLWQAEEVTIEPTPGEVRVYLRTRAPRNTTPQTRADVYTGDQQTNLYRAFYGKRFTNGGLVQVNLQQYGTGGRGSRNGGGGDAVNALVRLGWARGNRSLDVTFTRLDRRRNQTTDYFTLDSVLVNFVGRRDEGYIRAGVGDPERGVWAQAIANVLHFRLESPQRLPVASTDTTTQVFPDTNTYQNQYVLTGGLTRWGVRFTATDRYRTGYGARGYHAPSLRASYERDRLTLSAVAERVGTDSTKRLDLSGRLAVLPRVAVVGGLSTTNGDSAVGGTRQVARVELAAQVARAAWLSIGRIQRGAQILSPPRVYAVPGGTPVAVREGQVGGTVATLRGEVLPFITADVGGTVWNSAGYYRPRYEGRAELRFASNFLRRFPSGEFGVTAALSDAYRSAVAFPLVPSGNATGTPTITLGRAGASNLIRALLEIRIQRAVLTFESRNVGSRLYQEVPGIYMPRGAINYYGVRWEFSN